MLTSAATFEHHYSVDEFAERWGMNTDFVRSLFLHESGLVGFAQDREGRVYRTLRVAESVRQRAHARLRRLH